MNPPSTYRALNIIGLLITLAVNYLANALPINGLDTGAVAALYPNLFVPAGYAFSIWGVIYFLLLAFVVYQARGWWDSSVDETYLSAIGPWFFYSCLCNAAWILAWHYLQPLIALGLMLALLFCLIQVYLRLKQYPPGGRFRWIVRLPFRLYLGWISVATIANTTALLVHYDWQPPLLSEAGWAAAMVGVATALGAYFIWKLGDRIYPLVIIWAITAIYVGRTQEGNLTTSLLVAIAAGVVLLSGSLLWQLIFYRRG